MYQTSKIVCVLENFHYINDTFLFHLDEDLEK